jgi:hypothetical protein
LAHIKFGDNPSSPALPSLSIFLFLISNFD